MQEFGKILILLSGNEAYLEDLIRNLFIQSSKMSHQNGDIILINLAQADSDSPDVSHAAIREQFLQLARHSARALAVAGMDIYHDQQQERVIELINAYRRLGHLQANIDPLGLYKGIYNPTLELAYYGFTDTRFRIKHLMWIHLLALNKPTATLSEIYQALRRVYCSTIGFEYMHINRMEEVEWIRERIEQGWANFKPTNEEKLRILRSFSCCRWIGKIS